MLFRVLVSLMLVTALSADTIVSGFAYGAQKIKIPFSSVAVISVFCSAVLAVSLFFGRLIGGLLPARLSSAICFAILLVLGLSKIFDSGIRNFIRMRGGIDKKIEFSAFNLGFILNIYANPEEADRDCSKTLSPTEALWLGAALSLDGLAVGFGVGMVNVNILLAAGFSLICNIICMTLGCFVGNRIASKARFDFSWLGGVLLIALAAIKLVR